MRLARLFCVALLWLAPWFARAADDDLRLRIVWGGGGERVWQGSIAVSDGRLSAPRPLGIDADEAGSMWLAEGADRGRLVIRQKSPRSYDGVDLTIAASHDAKLLAEFTASGVPPVKWEVPLSAMLGGPQSRKLDEQGNRLVVQRAPGDSLRIQMPRESLVFAAGETFSFTLQPHMLPIAAGTRLKLKVQLSPARNPRELWSMVQTIAAGEAAALPVEVPLREPEGAYDLIITATTNPSWTQAMRQPLARNKVVAERKVQLLVMQAKGPVAATRRELELAQVSLIDPVNPRWWESTFAKLPAWFRRAPSGPWGNGTLQVVRHPLGDMAQLAPNGGKGEVSWEAYVLSTAQPGRPHIVEVEYPSDVPQTMGISVLEPDVSGAIMPFGLDSGVDVAEDLVVDRPRLLRHRIVFWPRTANPILLMTNHRDAQPAQYGKIRLLAGWEHLPPAPGVAGRKGQRTIAAYYDRPLFPENFSASRALDEESGFGLDDWTTFHESGLRLAEYLRHVGYNTLVLSAMAEGSALYPSRLVEPTPRFDKGTLFAAGHDAVRKDVLEMLYRVCDREALQLVAAVDFSAPLPAMEARLRGDSAAADGLTWIGSQGEAYQAANPPRRGLSPYYNTLHPDVQAAMLEVVGELADRYKQHTSFSGIAVQLSAQGYAQLPGPNWGLDDATIARFERETRLRVPGKGENRFAARAEFLAGPGRTAWLTWRAETLARFYRKMQNELASRRRDARLYLSSGSALTEASDPALRPALGRKGTLSDALLRVGIDPQLYVAADGPVLLRPERIAPGSAASAWAAAQEMAQWPDFDRCFTTQTTTASHFLQQPIETRLSSFDEKSPFKPTYTLLITHAAPSERQNRRRFVHSLATLDAQAIFDGGWLLSLGQEDAIRGLLATYRKLPDVRMERVADSDGAQPVVFRSATFGGRTYVYAVNDSPLRLTARVHIAARSTCQCEELSGLRKISPLAADDDGLSWNVDLGPYDLVAVSLSEPDAQLSRPQVAISGAVEGAIEQRIRDLGSKAVSLRSAPPLKAPTNAGFEESADDDSVPGWTKTQRTGVMIARQTRSKRSGDAAMHVRTDGPVACLVSKPFAAPTTGRISMSVWLRTTDPRQQPPLRLAFEGRLNGETYYRYAELGRAEAGQPAVPLTAEWAQYVFPVEDLPLSGLTQLRVRVDLMGAGEVYIDDMQLFDLSFNEREHRELAKLITVAQYQLQSGRLGDCLRVLDGYWPTFIAQHAPVEPTALAKAPKPPAAAPEPPKPPANRTGLLDKVKDAIPRF